MSILKRVSADIIEKSVAREDAVLIAKWEKLGLLEGLDVKRVTKATMARLLENQAKELLRESTTMESGAVEGFASVAFPIVRRVFAGLIANDLVSVQSMSLPSGLIFYLDYTRTAARGPFAAGESVYGQGRVGSGIASGALISGSNAEKGFYNLSQGYSQATGSEIVPSASITELAAVTLSTGSANMADATKALFSFDADLLNDGDVASGSSANLYLHRLTMTPSGSNWTQRSVSALMNLNATTLSGSGARLVRRLTSLDSAGLLTLYTVSAQASLPAFSGAVLNLSFAVIDSIIAGSSVGSVVGTTVWPLEAEADIPELNIKVNTLGINTQTRKLKAVWTPELSQDLNAYHNVDAEVELTGILSDSIALEVDQEIQHELVIGATAGKLYWSRRPGKFVNPNTGADLTGNGTGLPAFTGNVSMWYETLLERVNDLSAAIHRKTLMGGATFIVCGPEVASILEMTHGFRADVAIDDEKGSAGTFKSGTVSKKWDIFVNPYFPRNLMLVGRKGKGFLEAGFVYAPYIPLQTTPVIFDPYDFTPRRGVSTRYGKKLVRPDCYGLLIVTDLQG